MPDALLCTVTPPTGDTVAYVTGFQASYNSENMSSGKSLGIIAVLQVNASSVVACRLDLYLQRQPNKQNQLPGSVSHAHIAPVGIILWSLSPCQLFSSHLACLSSTQLVSKNLNYHADTLLPSPAIFNFPQEHLPNYSCITHLLYPCLKSQCCLYMPLSEGASS